MPIRQHHALAIIQGVLLGIPRDGEIVDARVAPLVDDGVVHRQYDTTAWLHNAPQLCQGCRPVPQVVQHEGYDDVIERTVGEWKWLAKVSYVQGCVLTQPLPRQLDHRRTGIEAGDDGPFSEQRCRQGPRATPSIEDPVTIDIPGKIDHRRPLVVGVEETGL